MSPGVAHTRCSELYPKNIRWFLVPSRELTSIRRVNDLRVPTRNPCHRDCGAVVTWPCSRPPCDPPGPSPAPPLLHGNTFLECKPQGHLVDPRSSLPQFLPRSYWELAQTTSSSFTVGDLSDKQRSQRLRFVFEHLILTVRPVPTRSVCTCSAFFDRTRLSLASNI
jgi:hypothetical protein